MKKALFVGIATLLGLGACDSETGGGGGGDDGTSSGTTSAGTNVTASDTLPTTEPPGTSSSTTSSTTSAESSSSAGSTTTESTTADTDTGDESSSSSTGGETGVTPCQPEMSRADIQRWATDAHSRMPTFAEFALPLSDMTARASVAGTLSDVPDPQAGGGDGGFITDPDGGGGSIACSVWDQDCEEGEKCAAWANDGGSAWNAARCVPVDADPVGPGETCTVDGSGVSGIDNCDAESMCWAVDGETNEGTCVALCQGSPEAPTCAPEATACSISNEGVLIVCLPICNPLADECADGQGCFPVGGEFFQCAPEAGGDNSGPGDPCEFINACEDGTGCVNSAIVPGCPAGSAGCCSSFCDLAAKDPGCLDGQECVPWYEMGQEPDVCLEGVGICSTP